MRRALFWLFALGLATGCGSPGAPRSTATEPSAAVGPENRLDESIQGRIVHVHPSLRLVVMDFPVLRLPEQNQVLPVYRQDVKVGEVKVTGPFMDTTAGGEILRGEARLGDVVREDLREPTPQP
jgi:hypothetical protein